MRTIRLSAAAAATLLVAACGDTATEAANVSELKGDSAVIEKSNADRSPAPVAAQQSQVENNMDAADKAQNKEQAGNEAYTAEFIKDSLIPAFEQVAPMKLDEDMSIVRLDAEGRKIFYILDYHPRNRRAVIPAEMQEYLNKLAASVCQAESNRELISKVESLGYRMEYQGDRIAEYICK